MKHVLILTSCLFLAGCSTPAYFTLPAQKFESPEVRGQWQGGIELHIQQPIYVITHSDSADNPPDDSGAGPSLDLPNDESAFFLLGFENFSMAARLGLGHKFEVSGHAGTVHSPSSARVKYQALGDVSGPEEGEVDNTNKWVGSLFASYLYSYSKRDGSGNSDDDTLGLVDDVTVRIQNVGYDVGLVAGYRVKENVLPYLTLAYTNLRTDVRINNFDTNDEYDFEDEITTQIAINPGVRIEAAEIAYFALEPSISQTKYADKTHKWYVTWGLLGGLQW